MTLDFQNAVGILFFQVATENVNSGAVVLLLAANMTESTHNLGLLKDESQ
jgi:hypothetical protein